MPRALRLGLVAVLAAAVLVLVLWQRHRGAPTVPPAVTSAAPAVTGPSAAAARAEEDGATPSAGRRLDPMARAHLAAAIFDARSRRRARATAASSSGSAPALPAPAGDDLDKDYIKQQVGELLPLLSECYEHALDDDAQLAGTLVVEFTIGGEPEIGGLVETSEVVSDGTTIAHAGMIECVRETMYAAELEPPAQGGQVVVRYPFMFRPDGAPD